MSLPKNDRGQFPTNIIQLQWICLNVKFLDNLEPDQVCRPGGGEGGGREGERGGCRVLPFRWSSSLGNDDICLCKQGLILFCETKRNETKRKKKYIGEGEKMLINLNTA